MGAYTCRTAKDILGMMALPYPVSARVGRSPCSHHSWILFWRGLGRWENGLYRVCRHCGWIEQKTAGRWRSVSLFYAATLDENAATGNDA